MKKTLLVALMGIFILSCATTGRKIDQAAADSIKKGETTRAQVGQMLGSPELITRSSTGDTVYVYQYSRATAKPSTFIPFIGGFVGGVDVQQQMTTITFGSDDIVKDYSTTQGATETDMGLAAGGKPATPEVEGDKRPK